MSQNSFNIPTIEAIANLILPLEKSLKDLQTIIESKESPKKFYRNKDLKKIFGLSENTIISYRKKNILPFTTIGDVYYYPVKEINKILEQNSNQCRSG